MHINLDETTVAQLTKLAYQHQLTIDDMVKHLMASVDEDVVNVPRSNQSYEAIRYSGLFEQSNDAVFLIGLDGQHLDCNQRAADFLGYTLEELNQLSAKDTVKQSESTQSAKVLERLLAGETIPPYQRTFIHKDGSDRPAEVNVECIFDGEGNPLYIQSIMRDIRERLKLEQHIRESEDLYRTILNTMAEGVVIHDPTGEIVLVNPAAEELIGLSADQMRGLTPIDPSWRTIREDGSNFSGEEHPASITISQHIPQYNVIMGVYKPDDSLTWISITSIPLNNEDGTLRNVIVTFSDITDLKHAQEQAVAVAVERERVNVLAQFMQVASHEFRTPLSIIQTSTYLVRRKFDDDTLDSYLEKIDMQVKRVDRLVNRLLIMAQLDAIHQLANNRRVHVGYFINELVHGFSERLQKHNLTLQLTDTSQEIYIQSEGVYLMRAFSAIMNNAIAHSETGGVITLSIEIENHLVVFTIEDQGTGIEPSAMPHIFERFWRADVAHSSEGFGLGLPLAMRIIDLHNGTISIESEFGFGTTVTVSLPLVAEAHPV